MGLLNLYNESIPQFPLGASILDTTTSYPSTATGTPTSTANPASATPGLQVYNAENTYLNSLSTPTLLVQKNTSPLDESFNKTNLDIEQAGVDGGIPYKQIKDPTIYPVTTNHVSEIRGFFPDPSKPAEKYNQTFNPQNTYLNFIDKYTR